MSNSRILLIFLTMALLLISACAPPPPPTAEAPAAKAPTSIEQSTQEVAAEALNVAPETITVLEVEEVVWSDASLGCPQPGIMYAQVITPGYKATVEVEGETYDVHLDANGRGIVCSSKP